jgi:hypothetical protein
MERNDDEINDLMSPSDEGTEQRIRDRRERLLRCDELRRQLAALTSGLEGELMAEGLTRGQAEFDALHAGLAAVTETLAALAGRVAALEAIESHRAAPASQQRFSEADLQQLEAHLAKHFDDALAAAGGWPVTGSLT